MGQVARDFKKLVVWQKAHRLVLDVYRHTEKFPRSQLYSLTSQMQRAAMSVPANIAEGCGRGGNAELCRFMRIALGSSTELTYYMIVARDLGYLQPAEADDLHGVATEINRMLAAYINKVSSSAEC